MLNDFFGHSLQETSMVDNQSLQLDDIMIWFYSKLIKILIITYPCFTILIK